MDKITVELCACNKCIMMGAMDMREHIESLNELEDSSARVPIEVTMNQSICNREEPDISPLVIINGERIEKANSETVMEKIMQLSKRK